MRTFLVLLALSTAVVLFGQEQKKGPNPFANPPKNLKVLPAGAPLGPIMVGIRTSLGVACNYCHVQGDFASDDNPKKEIARNMMRMVGDINSKFPDGKQHVGCWTCHRGKTEPELNPPAAEGAGAGGPGRGAPPAPQQ